MKIKVQELTAESFSPYGSFVNPLDGFEESGDTGFQADRMLYHVGGNLGSISTIHMKWRPLKLTVTEYHDECEEVFGGFGCDVLFHACLLSKDNEAIMDSLAVFRLPAGAYARVKRRVLHYSGFVINEEDNAYGIVMLSPSAYTIDCKVINFDVPIEIII